MPGKGKLATSDNLQICTACGTQFPTKEGKSSCRICDDPRQFVPPSGQSFTTLAKMREDGYKNHFKQDEYNDKIWSIWTEPKFGIGERAILLQTPHGNVLWDLIAFLDEETVEKINDLGGISAMVISHPHYYSTWKTWASTFDCPVHVAKADSVWLEQAFAPEVNLQLFTETHKEILPGVTAVICGGHFDGSLCLHWDRTLFIADTLVINPSGQNPSAPTPGDGVSSYSFLWSIPNRIPMDPDAIHGMWKALKHPDIVFDTTLGAFLGLDVRSKGPGDDLKERVLESMKINVRAMGWRDHGIMGEKM